MLSKIDSLVQICKSMKIVIYHMRNTQHIRKSIHILQRIIIWQKISVSQDANRMTMKIKLNGWLLFFHYFSCSDHLKVFHSNQGGKIATLSQFWDWWLIFDTLTFFKFFLTSINSVKKRKTFNRCRRLKLKSVDPSWVIKEDK